MPIKFRRKRRTIRRKKRTIRRRRNRNRTIRVPRNVFLHPFPSQKVVKMRFVENVTINPAASGLSAHYFSANGAYEPDITGASTHSPMYWDQVANIGYDHYVVLGSKIKVTPVYTGTANKEGGMYGIYLDDDTSVTYGTAEEIIEGPQKNSRWAILGDTTAGAGKLNQVTRLGYSPRKFFGVKDPSDVDKLRAVTGGMPSDQAYFVIWYGSTALGQDPAQMNFLVEISYLVKFSERKRIAQS